MAESINAAILERLEKVVDTLQDNSMKMGQLLAVHNEKLDKQDRIDAVLFEKVESLHREVNRQATEIKAGCERDIRKVDDRLRLMEKKKLERIISFIREEMMTTGSTAGNPGFSSKADAEGPTAGFDPVMKKPIRRKKTIGLWAGSLKQKKK